MFPDLFKRLKPLYGKQIDYLWLEYQTADTERRGEIESLLTILAAKRLGIAIGDEKIVLEPPPEHVIGQGEYLFGEISYPGIEPYPFCVKRNELLRHVFILGPTGTGKSTLIIGLLQQFLADHTVFMVFDFKRNYRGLLSNRENAAMVVITVGRDIAPLSLNALSPPAGVEFLEWAEALTDIISAAYLLMQGARNVLKEALIKATNEYGQQATLAHAYRVLNGELLACRPGSRKYGWLESSARSLEELSKGGFGKALNAQYPMGLSPLLEVPVVFELHGLGDDQKRFFCLFMLQSILLLRKNQTARREVLHHVLVFDESHNVFPKDQYGELSVPSRLAREVREYGEAIIAATQQSDVADSLIANAGIKVILRCDFPRDVDFASRLMQLDQRWFPKIPLGQGIARLPTRYYQPFLFTFTEQPIKNRTVTDHQIHEHWQQGHLSSSLSSHEITGLPEVAEKERLLLEDIGINPITNITGRYERLHWNVKTGNHTKDDLIRKGLAYFEPVPTPSGRIKILCLTTLGKEYLQSQGRTPQSTGRGSAEHEYWRHALRCELVKNGYTVEDEYPVGEGKAVDLHAKKENHEVYLEIETGKSDIAANITKCQGLKGTVVFFFVNRELRDIWHEQLFLLADVLALTPTDIDHLAIALR